MDYKSPIHPQFYEDCSKVTRDYEKLWGRWSDDSQLLHIITEVAEVKDVLRNKNNKYGMYGSNGHLLKLRDELADVFLTSIATADFLGIPIEDLNIAIMTKLAEVEQRVKKLSAPQVVPKTKNESKQEVLPSSAHK